MRPKGNAPDLATQGYMHLRQGDEQRALACFKEALSTGPDTPQLHHEVGRLLLRRGDHEQAWHHLQHACAADTATADTWCDLGSAALETGQFDAAEAALKRALNLNPGHIIALYTHGTLNRLRHQYEAALEDFNRAIQADPKSVAALIAAAACEADRGNLEPAVKLLENGLRSEPNNAALHQNLALILLRFGELERGFDEYEWRLGDGAYNSPPGHPTPSPWHGQDLTNSHLLIWLEQGLGDQILNSTMIPEAARRAKHCTVEANSRLVPLLQRSFPDVTVIAHESAEAQAIAPDYQSAGWSLARYTRSTWNAFPKFAPRLVPDGRLSRQLQRKYKDLSKNRPLIGFSWKSRGRAGAHKTPPLDAWKSLLSQLDGYFLNLQFDATPEEIKYIREMTGDRFLHDQDLDQSGNLDILAAQIEAVDMIVTVSNTTTHLAGALGKPSWALIPEGYASFWYWFRNRADSPWYPALQLIRQPEPGDWRGAVDQAHKAISNSLRTQGPLPS